MKKIIAVLFATLLVVSTLIAAPATGPRKILTAKDVQNFIDNYEALDAELTAFGDKYDEMFAGVEGESVSSMMNRYRTIAVPAEVQAVMKKHGFAENGFEKLMVITLGYTSLIMEAALAELETSLAEMPEMQSYMETYKQQLAEFSQSIHPDDLKLIKARQSDLETLLGKPEDEEYSDEYSEDYSDEYSEDYSDYEDD